MTDDVLGKVVTAQRRRLIASIMGPLEESVRHQVSEAEWQALRKRVIGAVGVFSDFTLDCIRASAQDVFLNADGVEVYDVLSRRGGD